MFGNRRLAKRSIIGTKVCALWQDGRFYPGVIRSVPDDTESELGKYTVLFDDGFEKDLVGKDIIGPGFQNLINSSLKFQQKVYLTLNGREVQGVVLKQDSKTNEVLVSVQFSTNEEVELIKRIDELRLLESRKSARLVDQDTDYSKMADVILTPDNKKRPVSHVIDVPAKTPRHRRPVDDERENSPGNDEDDVEMMDETIAAMVLTSLSCSPASPQFPVSMTETTDKGNSLLSTSANSSGFYSERSDPSPPLSSHLSESAPAATVGTIFGSYTGKDDGIDLQERVEEYFDECDEPKRKRSLQAQKKTMYQCTWKGCAKIHNTCSGIEKHVRTKHLGLMDTEDLSDHEEEFYYTEIEVNVDNVTKTFSDMFTSSPPETSFIEMHHGIPDHDYQKKEPRQPVHTFASSVPSGGFFTQGTGQTTTPISVPPIKRSLSWQNNTATSPGAVSSQSNSTRSSKMSLQERMQQHQAQSPKSHMLSSPPKSISGHKKSRSEVRKCRKVYGMENRDMWCTQCKWKKACSRFTD